MTFIVINYTLLRSLISEFEYCLEWRAGKPALDKVNAFLENFYHGRKVTNTVETFELNILVQSKLDKNLFENIFSNARYSEHKC